MLKQALSSLTSLFFPHICAGCGTDVLPASKILCLRCTHALPFTNFHWHAGNAVEKIFWGRLPVVHATSMCFFTKDSLLQNLLHQLKYKGNKAVGLYLGEQLGQLLQATNRFAGIDALVPLPLFAARQKKRGYNQATLLCEGISKVTGIPCLNQAVTRTTATETQTHKNRIQRWQNMEGRFLVNNEAMLKGKHLLLVDDVITTGATLEACGRAILTIEGTRLSIATLAYTVR